MIRSTSAGRGVTVSQGSALNGPLGLVIAPNGHILTVNSADGNIVETTPSGLQVADDARLLRQPAGGRRAVRPGRGAGRSRLRVDDATNTLNLLH